MNPFVRLPEVTKALKWAAIATSLLALAFLAGFLSHCGGTVCDPIMDAGTDADADGPSPIGFDPRCVLDGGSILICDSPISWTWIDDAGVVTPCFASSCPLGSVCTVITADSAPITGVCQ